MYCLRQKNIGLCALEAALLEVMAEMPSLAPGEPSDGFHVQPIGTHAAAVDRLRCTHGYQFIGAAEGGPVLCPAWVSSGSWTQSTHINWQRYLDAATGGGVPWETQVDRQARRKQPMTSDAEAEVFDDATNVSVVIFQQGPLFTNWWAQAEHKCSIGLPHRFVFSFGAAGPPGRPATSQFGQDVALPIAKQFFRLLLQRLGPQAPLPTDSPLFTWNGGEDVTEAVWSFRDTCFRLNQEHTQDETNAACLNKAAYWLASVGFLNSVLMQLWPAVLDSKATVRLENKIAVEAVKVAMDFFTFRVLFGASILSAEIRELAWVKKRRPRRSDKCRWDPAAVLLLQSSCGACINSHIAAQAGPLFAGLARNDTPEHEQAAAKQKYLESINFLALRGFGVIALQEKARGMLAYCVDGKEMFLWFLCF